MMRTQRLTDRRGTGLACLLGVGLAACSYVERDPDWAERGARLTEAAAFAPTPRRLDGLDLPEAASRVAKGDRILYGIEFEKAGRRRDWLVEVEVLDPEYEPYRTRSGETRAFLELAVRVCDETGAEVGQDVVYVSREDLVFGLAKACRGEAVPAPAGARLFFTSADDVRLEDPGGRSLGGFDDVDGVSYCRSQAGLALANMLHVVRKSEVLFDILWTVIDKPSIFSVVTNLGVRVSIGEAFEDARQLAPLRIDGQEFAVHELPVEMRLNGTPALRAMVLVTEPRSPLNLSAGILGVDAFQPSDPSARVSLRVLAARRAR